jgi:hypothetical protein
MASDNSEQPHFDFVSVLLADLLADLGRRWAPADLAQRLFRKVQGDRSDFSDVMHAIIACESRPLLEAKCHNNVQR